MKNIRFSEVVNNPELFDEYLNLAKYLLPVNALNCEPISKLSWGLIKETQYAISVGSLDNEAFIKMFSDFTKYPIQKIHKLGVIDFFYQIKWIIEELRVLTEKESNVLGSQLTPEQMEAGYEDLQIFGYKATTHALAGKDILKHDAVEKLPYEQVFSVLYLEKMTAEIEEKLWKIRNPSLK